MKLWSAPSGDEALRLGPEDCLVVLNFAGPRRVLSTSPFNGGLRGDLRQVFNYCCATAEGDCLPMRAPTYEEHLSIIAGELGLNPSTCAGLSTLARMRNMAILSDGWGGACVTAFVTAGLEVNAGRPGDPASWDEEAELRSRKPAAGPEGTVNILLHFSCALSDGALTRAMITLTEAKSAALQELQVAGRWSHGVATGSGTDGAIVVADAASPLCLTNTGNHSKLGEVVGRVTKEAVKEALRLQTDLTPALQRDVLRRVERFGLNKERLRRRCGGEPERFAAALSEVRRRGDLAASASLTVHVMDQLEWGLLLPEEALGVLSPLWERMEVRPPAPSAGAGETVERLTALLEDALADAISTEMRRESVGK